MDKEKVISLRMGTEDIQSMDDFLEGHPELGGRSLFIRTAVREYIDRDADVPQAKNDNGEYIRFTGPEYEVMDRQIAKGIYLDRQEAVRSMLRSYFQSEQIVKENASSIYEAAISDLER